MADIIETVNAIISSNNNKDINERDNNGRTILMLAVIQKNLNAVKTILDAGADINIEDDWAYTALDHAAVNNFPDAEKLLIQKGADVNRVAGYGRTALMLAAGANSADAIKILIENKANIDTKDTLHKWTALMHAAYKNSPDAVRILMKNGANANLRTDGDCFNTALTIAASKNSIDALKALIDCGVDINVKDNIGNTALDVAKWYVKDRKTGYEMIELLKEAKSRNFSRRTLPWIIVAAAVLVFFSFLSK